MIPEDENDPTFRVKVPLSHADMERVIAGLSYMADILDKDAVNSKTTFVSILTRNERDEFRKLRDELTGYLRHWDEYTVED